jgi:hypothetical protein
VLYLPEKQQSLLIQTFLEFDNDGKVSTYTRYAGIILVIIQEENRAS